MKKHIFKLFPQFTNEVTNFLNYFASFSMFSQAIYFKGKLYDEQNFYVRFIMFISQFKCKQSQKVSDVCLSALGS